MIALTHYEHPLRETPFHARTRAACRTHRWGAWAGYATVLTYEDTAMEYSAIRNASSVYDLCPMIKYRVTGPGAAEMLQRLTLRDVDRLTPGGVQYTAWCDDDGHLIDDGTLFRLGPQDFRLCCQERHLPWLLDSAQGFDCTVADETDAVAALSVQGPTSAAVLIRAGFDVTALRPFRMADFAFGGGRVMVSRTGFTGDLGYEVWIAPDLALPLWDHLFAYGAAVGLRPVGSEALNIARLEAGFIQTGADFVPAHQAVREDRARSPLDMGLDWLIDWDKGQFTGRRALLAERAAGPRWAFVGLEIAGNVSAEGAILYHRKRREVGVVTGACWSPILKSSIALAQIDARYRDGADLWAEIYALRELHYAKLMMRARVAERPFFRPDRRRATPPGGF